MPLRQLQIFVPASNDAELCEALDSLQLKPLWKGRDDPGWGIMAVIVLDAYDAEPLMQELTRRFEHLDHFRLALFDAVAMYPHPKEQPEPEDTAADYDEPAVEAEPEKSKPKNPARVAIQELEEKLRSSSNLDRDYVIAVLLSAVVAAVGLIKDSTAVVIGAMVIAPLLGPNIALALGTTLGKVELMRRALRTNLAGFVIAFGFAILLGLLLGADPDIPEIASRTSVDTADVVLALASGAAGAMAFTSGVPVALVGVMVAVALMPPLVTAGILMGAGHTESAAAAMLLTLANVIAVNLSAVMTFWLKRVRPWSYYEAPVAAGMVRRAALTWTLLLLVLWGIIVLS